jgi:TRAP-type mannitol/chloroaromatic compound transport system permease small subunit
MIRKVIKAIDNINEWTGRSVRWLAVFLMLVICAEVFMRYVLNKPTIQGPVIASFSGAALYTLSWGYVHLHKRHIRVDVFYASFPQRVKAVIDVLFAVLFLLPLITLLTYAGWEWMWYAYATTERSLMTFWYPITSPVRTLVFIGLVLFALEGLAQFARDIYTLVRNRAYD